MPTILCFNIFIGFANNEGEKLGGKVMKKKGFVFYASYYEAIQTLSVKNKLLAYEAITRYALYQDVMPNLPSRVLAILMVAMPTIDSNFEKYNKKVAKTQKGMSEFDEITNKKVDLPLKEEVPSSMQGYDELREDDDN